MLISPSPPFFLAVVPDWFEVSIKIISSAGTFLVAVLAIWGDRVRTWSNGPKLSVHLQPEVNGSTVPLNNGDVGAYVLIVIRNLRPLSTAKECRVFIEKIERKSSDGGFYPLFLPHPLQLKWTPAEDTTAVRTIYTEWMADLGRITKLQRYFDPQIYHRPNNFKGAAQPNDVVRYSVRVYAESSKPSKLFTFQVSWNGLWSDKLSEMHAHMGITDVTN